VGGRGGGAADAPPHFDWDVVLPGISGALGAGAFLALVQGRALVGVAWEAALAELIPRYSTNQDYRRYDLVAELARRGLFREMGRRATPRVAFRQSVDDYVESFHTRNGFSRQRMAGSTAAEFGDRLRALVSPHCPDGLVRGHTMASVVWGIPSAETPPGPGPS